MTTCSDWIFSGRTCRRYPQCTAALKLLIRGPVTVNEMSKWRETDSHDRCEPQKCSESVRNVSEGLGSPIFPFLSQFKEVSKSFYRRHSRKDRGIPTGEWGEKAKRSVRRLTSKSQTCNTVLKWIHAFSPIMSRRAYIQTEWTFHFRPTHKLLHYNNNNNKFRNEFSANAVCVCVCLARVGW